MRYASIEFTQTPTKGSSIKFGGQPDWIADSQWPLSKSTGKPMKFIGQISLNKVLFLTSQGQMAYIFMSDEDEEYIDQTWDPDAGENAVIIQPSSVKPQCLYSDLKTGPTLEREFFVSLTTKEEASENEPFEGNKIGGLPLWLQADETPSNGDWQLLLQLNSEKVPFYVNFGDAGTGYAFINQEGTVGKFLWQCF